MTWVTPRAASASAGLAPRKSGSAIGIGSTLPRVISTRGADRPDRGRPATRPIEAAATAAVRTRRRDGQPAMTDDLYFLMLSISNGSADAMNEGSYPPNISDGLKESGISFQASYFEGANMVYG